MGKGLGWKRSRGTLTLFLGLDARVNNKVSELVKFSVPPDTYEVTSGDDLWGMTFTGDIQTSKQCLSTETQNAQLTYKDQSPE